MVYKQTNKHKSYTKINQHFHINPVKIHTHTLSTAYIALHKCHAIIIINNQSMRHRQSKRCRQSQYYLTDLSLLLALSKSLSRDDRWPRELPPRSLHSSRSISDRSGVGRSQLDFMGGVKSSSSHVVRDGLSVNKYMKSQYNWKEKD